jgi:hypothetical protein
LAISFLVIGYLLVGGILYDCHYCIGDTPRSFKFERPLAIKFREAFLLFFYRCLMQDGLSCFTIVNLSFVESWFTGLNSSKLTDRAT